MGFNIADLIGGGLASTVKGIVGSFKLDPEKKAEFQAAIDENDAKFKVAELDLQSKIQDQIGKEIEASADIIKVESQSQSWLPRNVRPLLLLLWGAIITFNPFVAIITQFTNHPIMPITLDPWIYKLTIVGYTGYVSWRSIEKIKNSDN